MDKKKNKLKIGKSSNSQLYLDRINFKIPKSNRSTRVFNQLSYRKFLPDSKSSQSAIEFIILIGVVIFFFTVFFIALSQSMSEKTRQRQSNSVEDVAINVQEEINLASKSSEGYNRNFKIPYDIGGRKYDINLTQGLVYIKTSDNKDALALPVQNVSGQLRKGDNLIKKNNGIIYLNP